MYCKLSCVQNENKRKMSIWNRFVLETLNLRGNFLNKDNWLRMTDKFWNRSKRTVSKQRNKLKATIPNTQVVVWSSQSHLCIFVCFFYLFIALYTQHTYMYCFIHAHNFSPASKCFKYDFLRKKNNIKIERKI